jgi:hypothetical protein
MGPKPWVHPHNDENMSRDSFMARDSDDPRVSEGPCCHRKALTSKFIESMDQDLICYGGNPSGRWVTCSTCHLSVGYWPRLGHTGKYRRRYNPETVRRALVMYDKTFNDPMNGKDFQLVLEKAEADARLEGRRQKGTGKGSKSKGYESKGKTAGASSSEPKPTASPPEASPRQGPRATSAQPRRRVPEPEKAYSVMSGISDAVLVTEPSRCVLPEPV